VGVSERMIKDISGNKRRGPVVGRQLNSSKEGWGKERTKNLEMGGSSLPILAKDCDRPSVPQGNPPWRTWVSKQLDCTKAYAQRGLGRW